MFIRVGYYIPHLEGRTDTESYDRKVLKKMWSPEEEMNTRLYIYSCEEIESALLSNIVVVIKLWKAKWDV